MADEERKSDGRELIRARVAVWRAQVWTAWLPAMVVLPGVMVVWAEVPKIIKLTVLGQNEHLSYLLPNFVENLAIWGGGLVILSLVSVGLVRLAPRPHQFQIVLGLAWMLGRFVTVILMFLGALYIIAIWIFRIGDLPWDAALLTRFVETTSTAGGLLLTGWIGVRRPVEVQCTRCGYAIGSVRSAPEVCPECRNRWKRVGGLRRWRRISIWWLVGAVGLLLLSGAIRFVAWR